MGPIPSRDECNAARLSALLGGGAITPAEHAAAIAHLDRCAACRETLERLAADAQWWTQLRDFAEPAGGPETAWAQHARGSDSFLSRTAGNATSERIGPYEIIEMLGAGGMGVVWKAHDPALNRPVAIKVLAPQLATSAAARRRFAREAQAAAAVVHEHVVAIHAVDEAEGLPYLVMQFVSGKSLQDRLDREGPLDAKEILRIGMQAAQGLAAAHAQGLVHRDIKPSNILLENGVERVKLTDFGLARAADDASVTHSGVVPGTPQYMAPEQARGELPDGRSDLFSLGSVLYAMCTGHAPFRAESALAVLRRVSDERPRPVREVNSDIPPALAAVIERLHAPHPADRYQTAAEVAECLGQLLAMIQQPKGLTTELPAPKPTGRLGARGAVISALALVVAIGLATCVVAVRDRATHAARDNGPREPTADFHGFDSPLAVTSIPAPTGAVRTIAGVVRGRDTQRPLAGVRVALPGTDASATTDADGRFTLEGRANGPASEQGRERLFVLAAEPTGAPYLAADVEIAGEPDGEVRADIALARGIPARLQLRDRSTGRPVRMAKVSYWPLHPNPHVDPALPRGGTYLYSRFAESRDGSYEGGVIAGPGAICVESYADHYGAVSVDPVAFFRPGQVAREGVDGTTEFGTRQLLALERGSGRGIHLLPQTEMSGIILINPAPGAGPLARELVLKDNRPPKTAPP